MSSDAMQGAALRSDTARGGRSEGSGVFQNLRSPVIDDALRTDADGVSHGGLSLSRYVAVGALLRAFPRPRKSEVLSQVGLDDKAWERGRTCWMAALRAPGDDAAALLEAWSDAFDRAWEILQADPPSMEDIESAKSRVAAPAEIPTYLRHQLGHQESAGQREPAAAEPGVAEAAPKARLQTTMPSLGVPAIVDLPFQGKLDAAPAAPAPATIRSKLTGTIATDAQIPGARILPFRAKSAPAAVAVVQPESPAPKPAELTVEQYASLTVELAFWPSARQATLARYGVADEAAFAALDASWRPRIAWEPGVVARWSDACRAYRSWLVERAQAAQ